MSKSLLDEINRQWQRQRADMARVNRRLNRVDVRERAEVAGSVPLVADESDLPASGQTGELLAVLSTGRLYFWNGAAWEWHVADHVRGYASTGALGTGTENQIGGADGRLWHHDGTEWRPLAPYYIVSNVNDVPNPFHGCLAYNTSLNRLYYWNGSAWQQVAIP